MTLFQAFGQFAGQSAVAPALPSDFEFITSTTFSAVTSVSVNNCFSADYDNYFLIRDASTSSNSSYISLRLRASGSDSSTGYRYSNFTAANTTNTGERSTSGTEMIALLGWTSTTAIGCAFAILSDPFNSVKTTAWTDTTRLPDTDIELWTRAHSHDTAASYDGFTALTSSGAVTMTGSIYVYGWKV